MQHMGDGGETRRVQRDEERRAFVVRRDSANGSLLEHAAQFPCLAGCEEYQIERLNHLRCEFHILLVLQIRSKSDEDLARLQQLAKLTDNETAACLEERALVPKDA